MMPRTPPLSLLVVTLIMGCADDAAPSGTDGLTDQCTATEIMLIEEIPDAGPKITEQVSALVAFGGPCFGAALEDDPEIAADCIVAEVTGSAATLSDPCMQCFGASVQCAAVACVTSCAGGNATLCLSCVESECYPELASCTGADLLLL